MTMTFRQKTVLILLGGCLLYFGFQSGKFCLRTSNSLTDPVTEYESRFDGIRHRLPPHGIVGYQDSETGLTEVERTARYFKAQYSLVPLVLDPNGCHAMNVVNLGSEIRVSGE